MCDVWGAKSQCDSVLSLLKNGITMEKKGFKKKKLQYTGTEVIRNP
jgi:hypothetical protein